MNEELVTWGKFARPLLALPSPDTRIILWDCAWTSHRKERVSFGNDRTCSGRGGGYLGVLTVVIIDVQNGSEHNGVQDVVHELLAPSAHILANMCGEPRQREQQSIW